MDNNRYKLLPKSYNVEKITDIKLSNQKVYFYVKWENFPTEQNTWEPPVNLSDSSVFQKFISDMYNKEQDNIIKTNLKLFQKDLDGMESQSEYEENNNLPQNLESPTKDLELECLEILNNAMIQHGINQSHLKVHLDHFTQLFTSIEDKFFVIVENSVDNDLPPYFKYTTNNMISESLIIEKSTKCVCYCNYYCYNIKCCPKTVTKIKDKREMADLEERHIMYECNDDCACDLSCNNRKTQIKSSRTLSLFKTENRGWGVRTKTEIPINTFIIEYVGKITHQREADTENPAYMYDLNFIHQKNNNINNNNNNNDDNNNNNEEFYTIDAQEYGNLSRFLNHSCDPNCKIWKVFQCDSDPKLFKVCFFSQRNILPDEELTINYNGDRGDKKREPIKSKLKCLCGSTNCIKYMFTK